MNMGRPSKNLNRSFDSDKIVKLNLDRSECFGVAKYCHKTDKHLTNTSHQLQDQVSTTSQHSLPYLNIFGLYHKYLEVGSWKLEVNHLKLVEPVN